MSCGRRTADEAPARAPSAPLRIGVDRGDDGLQEACRVLGARNMADLPIRVRRLLAAAIHATVGSYGGDHRIDVRRIRPDDPDADMADDYEAFNAAYDALPEANQRYGGPLADADVRGRYRFALRDAINAWLGAE